MKGQESELYLHLGIPKAASSYLQQKVFPRLKGVRYYPKPYFKRFPEILERKEHSRYLFSTEMFGRLEERAKKIADRFPYAKVILVFRRQDRWIRSRYKYYLWKSGTMDFRDFFDIWSDQGYWKWKDLYFRPRIDTVDAHFEEAPLVLLQEDLKAAPDAWLQRLKSYTGTDLPPQKIRRRPLKTSFSDKQLILLRTFNKRFPYRKPQGWPKPLKQLHMHARQGLNHLIALLALLFPSSYLKGKELIPSGDLEAIRAFYEEDWEYCKERVEKDEEG